MSAGLSELLHRVSVHTSPGGSDPSRRCESHEQQQAVLPVVHQRVRQRQRQQVSDPSRRCESHLQGKSDPSRCLITMKATNNKLCTSLDDEHCTRMNLYFVIISFCPLLLEAQPTILPCNYKRDPRGTRKRDRSESKSSKAETNTQSPLLLALALVTTIIQRLGIRLPLSTRL